MLMVSGAREVATKRWPFDSVAPHGYVAYTSANHEKRVTEQFAQRSVEHFLPLYESVRRRKDPRMTLHLPLFPGYVRAATATRPPKGLAGFWRFTPRRIPWQPAVLPDREIEALRTSLTAPRRILI
jgi:Transcription termination factor nusG